MSFRVHVVPLFLMSDEFREIRIASGQNHHALAFSSCLIGRDDDLAIIARSRPVLFIWSFVPTLRTYAPCTVTKELRVGKRLIEYRLLRALGQKGVQPQLDSPDKVTAFLKANAGRLIEGA
jgi:hypothetical protein